MNLRLSLPALALAGLTVGTLPGIALAQSQDPAQATQTQATGGDAAEAEEPETKRVCVMEKKTGSNFPRKVCRTVRSDMEDAQGQAGLDDLRQGREAQQISQQMGRSPG